MYLMGAGQPMMYPYPYMQQQQGVREKERQLLEDSIRQRGRETAVGKERTEGEKWQLHSLRREEQKGKKGNE